ncbi:MAG TPA: hypothetical protein VIF64_06640, partial [Pyrinomonadaceae bacterium]
RDFPFVISHFSFVIAGNSLPLKRLRNCNTTALGLESGLVRRDGAQVPSLNGTRISQPMTNEKCDMTNGKSLGALEVKDLSFA